MLVLLARKAIHVSPPIFHFPFCLTAFVGILLLGSILLLGAWPVVVFYKAVKYLSVIYGMRYYSAGFKKSIDSI